VIFETFIGVLTCVEDMRTQQYLITRDVDHHMVPI